MNENNYVLTVNGAANTQKIMRDLKTLFDTRESSQPGDRDFGISWACLDESPEIAESLFAMEAIKKVEKYIPKIEIEDITYQYIDGKMIPHIFITGRGGVE